MNGSRLFPGQGNAGFSLLSMLIAIGIIATVMMLMATSAARGARYAKLQTFRDEAADVRNFFRFRMHCNATRLLAGNVGTGGYIRSIALKPSGSRTLQTLAGNERWNNYFEVRCRDLRPGNKAKAEYECDYRHAPAYLAGIPPNEYGSNLETWRPLFVAPILCKAD